VRRYGSTDLYIPRCAEALRRARDAVICREYDRLIQTMSGNEAVQRLARTHRLSDRHIFNILKRMPESTINVGGAVQLKLLG
jgi:Mor family transcriptional regulator